jgi:carbon catabolite-derepressing protein kinase
LNSHEDAVKAAQLAVASQRASGKGGKNAKGKWHFGIRSRSPPIEVMAEIYNTLQVLGMQWKKKQCYEGPWDQDGRPMREAPPGQTREQKQKEKITEEKQNQALFFVETRCKIDNVVVSQVSQVCPVNKR